MHSRPNQLLLVILVLTTICALSAAVFTGIAAQNFFAPTPLQYELPNKVDPTYVHPGDPIRITIKQCVFDTVNGFVYYTIDRTLRERDNAAPARQLPQAAHVVPAGCSTTVASFNRVPADLAPGTWHIESGVVAYGAHGTKLSVTTTEWFTVVPSDQPLPDGE